MTTLNNRQIANENLITALYCRLSVEDLNSKDAESNSISNQKTILYDYAKQNGYHNTMFFVDDGTSGTSFDRDGFVELDRMVREGKVGTVIVKDLSRFGREHIEGDKLIQVVYPSLGITFISIQENVNSATGENMEMVPFFNIFNEMYAAQTSKKIRAVWKSKAEHGERVSATVPFGYMKSDEDKKQWIIDIPAAEVVRKIFNLCLDGKGPSQIARLLEEQQILSPTAYYYSIGRKCRNKNPLNPYRWDQKTIVGILENRQYTGCAVNFKSTTVSYKVHKVIHNNPEDYQIIPDMQEPIISEEKWLRVQELRKNKRRPTATGRTSLFSGLVFCPDCGAKLYFCTSKSTSPNQEFYCCSNYKSGRGTCKIHYIRNVVLERLVLEAISDFAEFVKNHEAVFLYMLAKKNTVMQREEHKKLKQSVEFGEKRIVEIDRLIEKIYEDNALGRLDDERYSKMMIRYEKEQQELKSTLAENKKKLSSAEQQNIDLRLLLRTLREISELDKLTPTLVNSLIERIEVHSNDKSSGHRYVKVDIYFTAVGMIDVPTEKELLNMIDEIKKTPQECRFIA